MTISWLISLFGFIIFARIIDHSVILVQISHKQRQMIAYSILFSQMFLFLSHKLPLQAVWWLWSAAFFGVFVVQLVTKKRQRGILESQALLFLDEIILQVRSGHGLNESFQSVRDEAPVFLKDMISKLNFGQNPSQLHVSGSLRTFYLELVDLKNTQYKTLERLLSLRAQMKWEQDFRRKSGQAKLQAQSQALVLTLLYVGLLVVSWGQAQSPIPWKIFIFSAVLFFSGLIWIFAIGRKIKWKI